MLSIGQFARLGGVSPRTLRHYGDLGILAPAAVDPTTGYRSYELGQLAELRRALALRDLGIGLDQIPGLLAAPVEQLRGMLRLREAEIAVAIAEDQERLRRVAVLLDALERGDVMQPLDIVVKRTEPVRIAETTGTAEGYGHEHIGPVFAVELPHLWGRLTEQGVEPGMCVAYYDWPDDDGRVVVHLGLAVGDQAVVEDGLRVVELPVVDVASTLLRGPIEGIGDEFEELARWIEASGYRVAERSRELYLAWSADDPAGNVVELQVPVAPV
jgi:DNA-binding transcriptional MerR regulator